MNRHSKRNAMRSYFVVFICLLIAPVVGLPFYGREDTYRADTVRASFRSSPEPAGKKPTQTVRQREDFSGAGEITAPGQTPDVGKPDLLVSWACQRTHWEESPDAMYTRGIAKNASSTRLSDVVVEVTFIGPEGDPLGTGKARLDDAHLSPGQTSTFFAFLPADGQTATCSLAFRSQDGPLRAVRAGALEPDAANPFVGRWIGPNGTVAMDFFRDGTTFVVSDQGVALGGGSYTVVDPNSVELSLTMPPEGVMTGYLYWHDRWRALGGRTDWGYAPSRDALVLLTPEEQIYFTRGAVPAIRELTAEVSEELVLEAQKRLKEEGFDPGPLDGILGAATRAALNDFQSSRKLKQTQELDEATVRALGLAWPKRHPPEKSPGEAQ